jgi:hypothetical protein
MIMDVKEAVEEHFYVKEVAEAVDVDLQREVEEEEVAA